MSDRDEISLGGSASCTSSDETVDENFNVIGQENSEIMLRKLPKTSVGKKATHNKHQGYSKVSRRDCGHHGKTNPLIEELDVFYRDRVKPRQAKKTKNRRIAYSVVWKVLLHSSNLEDWFDIGDIVRSGENYEGIVTNDAYNVEFWIPLNLGNNLMVYIHKAEEDGYVRVQPESHSPWKNLLCEDFLPATDVRVKLQTSVDKALSSYMDDVQHGNEKLPDEVQSIYLVIQGSSILLEVNDRLFIDLIPVIKVPDSCKEWCRRLSKSEPPSHAIAKPCIKPMSDPETLWQLSFAMVEEQMIESMTDAQFQLLLTFFEMRERDTFLMELSWYHFQTILFHLLDVYNEDSFWTSKQIGARFVDVLQRLEFYLGDKYLPHFYMPSVNLLSHLNNTTILKIKDRVKRLAKPTCSACGYLAILDPVLMTCFR